MTELIDLSRVRRRKTGFPVVSNGYWVTDPGRITSFMKTRVAALVRTGYLRYQDEARGLVRYRVVGGNHEYAQATELQLGGKI